MINFFKKNSFPIVILLLGITFFFVTFLKKAPEAEFKMTTQEMLVKIDGFEHVIKTQAHKMQNDTNAYIFVDLRSPYDFEAEHINNAVNIPTAFLLDEENMTVFKKLLKSGKTVVLYGQTERESISPWILLYEMGITNTKILYGGFECFVDNKVDCPTCYPRYDYAKIASQGGIKEVEVIKKKPPKKKKPIEKKKAIPIEKKVKLEAEGGC